MWIDMSVEWLLLIKDRKKQFTFVDVHLLTLLKRDSCFNGKSTMYYL